MTGSLERLARNEATFRAANEILERRATTTEKLLTFVCECGNDQCRETVRLTREEYEAVRSHAARFALARAHQGAGERVIEVFDRYTLVEKVGEAREVVEGLDMR